MTVARAGKPVPNNISGGHVDRGGTGVGGERGGGMESIDGADRPRILPAVKAPMPHSSVRVVPEAVTAVWMSAAALAMRRSSWRVSEICLLATLMCVPLCPTVGSGGGWIEGDGFICRGVSYGGRWVCGDFEFGRQEMADPLLRVSRIGRTSSDVRRR